MLQRYDIRSAGMAARQELIQVSFLIAIALPPSAVELWPRTQHSRQSRALAYKLKFL